MSSTRRSLPGFRLGVLPYTVKNVGVEWSGGGGGVDWSVEVEAGPAGHSILITTYLRGWYRILKLGIRRRYPKLYDLKLVK